MDAVDEYIRGQDAEKTLLSNAYGHGLLKKYMFTVNDNREVETICPEELNVLLCNFFMCAKRDDGAEYQPDVLSTIFRAINRYLDVKKYGLSISHDERFKKCRDVLAAKRKEVTKKGYGGKPNATRELTEEEVNRLFEEQYFSTKTGEGLYKGLWWLLAIHAGWRAVDEAKKLCWKDIELKSDPETKREYLTWASERGTKTRDGQENKGRRAYVPMIFATGTNRCPVTYYKLFREHRPIEMMEPDSPFFILVDRKKTINDTVWYHKKPMGKNTISDILPKAKKLFNFPGNVSNHSVRKTGINQLLDANVPGIYVAQHSGMKSTDSLKSYTTANQKQQLQMFNILSGVPQQHEAPEERPVLFSSQNSVSNENRTTTNMFAGASFVNCTLHFGEGSSSSRKRRLIIDSDEE